MWAQILNTLVGIWLMASPAFLNYSDAGAKSNYIVGPIVATIATVACWEATRGFRTTNIPLGIWLMLAPIILGYENPFPIMNDMACGSIIIVLALVRGEIKGSYGGGWKTLWDK